jgi:hypothetical protein
VARKYETVLKKSDLPVRETVPLLDNILTVLRSTVLTNSSLSRTDFDRRFVLESRCSQRKISRSRLPRSGNSLNVEMIETGSLAKIARTLYSDEGEEGHFSHTMLLAASM